MSLPEKSVTIQFVNPIPITIPPAPVTQLVIDSDSILDWIDDFEIIRKYFNGIIRAYRLTTQETYNNGFIIQLSRDQFQKIVICGEIDEKGNWKEKPKVSQFIKSLQLGCIDEDKYSEIKRLSDSPDTLLDHSYDEVLLQARSFFEQENYRMTIVEAVIALEIVLSSIIRRVATEKGVQEDNLENFFKDVGLVGMLEVVLKLLISEALPSKEIISGCKGANTIRNGIIHKARLSVSERDAQDGISNIETFVRHVQHLM
ncbi:hypothetical protein MUP77_05840 [Candidatus Bathyarchaeota archaeon]|nr:hypothetical protein [Candidatus Bathyarchaeota archaeon]